MASCKIYIKSTGKDKTNIRYRISDGKSVDLSYSSKISINPNSWDAKKECIKAKVLMPYGERQGLNTSIAELKEVVLKAYFNMVERGLEFTSKVLKIEVDKLLHPEKYLTLLENNSESSFLSIFDTYIRVSVGSVRREQNYQVVGRALQRFEVFKQNQNNRFRLSFNSISADTLREFEQFLLREVEISERFPELYINVKQPEERGYNTVAKFFKIIKAFYNWARKNEYTTADPFIKFENRGQVYGTPYYLTLEERNRIKDYDLSANSHLERQRDVFIFQCLVGCRVGDLLAFKKGNVIDGNLQYIANKSHDKKPETIIVPLHESAVNIINKYKDVEGDKLLPFISAQKYNMAIKEFFKTIGIDRRVTILNSKTRLQEQKPLYVVASSHLARRTFIGNLYKKVKDPNLIGALTGHSEGSRAFARYRTIDEELKKSVIDLLDD